MNNHDSCIYKQILLMMTTSSRKTCVQCANKDTHTHTHHNIPHHHHHSLHFTQDQKEREMKEKNKEEKQTQYRAQEGKSQHTE